MTVFWPNGSSQVFMDSSNSPYLTRPSRVGCMCLTEDVVRWWFHQVSAPSCARYLEIGSFDGVLLSLMAETFPTLEFVAIDPFEVACNTGSGHYGYWYDNNKNLGNVSLRFAKSEQALPALIEAGKRFSCIFIDGDHSYEVVKFDLEKSWELLEEGGLMACHDHDMPGVERACREFPHPFTVEVGMPIFRKTA